MSTIKIEREDTDTKGRYVATIEGVEGEGELTFSGKDFEKSIIVDHTAVPDSMRVKVLALLRSP